jgi:hypothetical protein
VKELRISCEECRGGSVGVRLSPEPLVSPDGELACLGSSFGRKPVPNQPFAVGLQEGLYHVGVELGASTTCGSSATSMKRGPGVNPFV